MDVREAAIWLSLDTRRILGRIYGVAGPTEKGRSCSLSALVSAD